MRIGVLSDFVSTAVPCGASLQSMLLARLLRERGHDVLVIGPDPGPGETGVDPQRLTFRSVSHPTYPGIRLALPWPPSRLGRLPVLDVVHAQLSSHLIHLGLLWRREHGTAMVNTHTLHLPSYVHNFISDRKQDSEVARGRGAWMARRLEGRLARLCNGCDEVIVQAPSLLEYWRHRGLTVPMSHIPRPIDPSRFRGLSPEDPFPASFARGGRLLTSCRIDREKDLPRLVRLFDRYIAPNHGTTSLTIIGDGPELKRIRKYAAEARHGHRIKLPGLVDPWSLGSWYRDADVFVHTSVSEVFGNVVNEAMWMGRPVVAMEDGMGVSGQIRSGVDGWLIDPGASSAEREFADRVLSLLGDRAESERLSRAASRIARLRSSPDVVIDQLEQVYERAIDHVRRQYSEREPSGTATLLRWGARFGHGLAWGAGMGTFVLASRMGRSLGIVRGPDG